MNTESVDAVLRSAVEEERLVGAVVAVLVDGAVQHRAAYGHADRELGVAMTPSRTFRLSSLTKPIVTAAVMRLVEDGVLDLTSPVTRWLPSFTPALPSGALGATRARAGPLPGL